MNKQEKIDFPLAAWFLGPKAEHSTEWSDIINYIFQDYIHWRRNYFPEDKNIITRRERREHEEWFDYLNTEIDKLVNHLKTHYPFHSPRYIAHMLSEQTLPSVVGYFAGMLYNPNNVTDEAAPITVELELEAGRMIAEMLGYNRNTCWAHLTSGGTIANFEAMWVARMAQFVPLMIKEFCQKHNYDFKVKVPNGSIHLITDINDLELLHLKPDESIFMPRKLAQYLIKEKGNAKSIINDINKHMAESRFNTNNYPIGQIYAELGLEHFIYVSEAAHYCFNKIAGLMGIGAKNVKLIPVDHKFRINVSALEEELFKLKPNQIPLAVVGIVGTTEEGAIDPTHDILKLRKKFQTEKNRSFWFHIDAAWGGYIRAIFNSEQLNADYDARPFDTIFNEFEELQDLNETIDFYDSEIDISWNNREIYQSVLTMREADSITIDPHKMGYIPYPAGVITFKNGLVTELISQKAQYISDEKGGMKNIDSPVNIRAVGPYILEGSKPGAAASSVFLAHKTIPLNMDGHGKIIKTTMLSTQRLHAYLSLHKNYFKKIEMQLFDSFDKDQTGFTFEPLYQPDSNLICYIAYPCIWSGNEFKKKDCSLELLNKLNREIYKKLSLSHSQGRHRRLPYNQEYFVSRTKFTQEQYHYKSIKNLLDSLHIGEEEYREHGLFVLRSTVMNPWYYTAYKSGEDYILNFVLNLHNEAKEVFDNEFNQPLNNS